MKVSLYYESNRKKDYTWLEVPDESEFNVMIERDYQERLAKAKPGEKVERRTAQEILTEEICKPTYNNEHRAKDHTISLESLDPHDRLLGAEHHSCRRRSSYKEYSMAADHAIYTKSPEEELATDEYEDLHQALEALSAEQRELLERVFLDGVSQRQIAAEENVSEVAVSQRIKRIRAKMERVLCRISY